MTDSGEPKSAMPALITTQPLIDLPAVKTSTTTIPVTPTTQPASRIDAIPMALCWALFAASAATLILQIWNYLS